MNQEGDNSESISNFASSKDGKVSENCKWHKIVQTHKQQLNYRNNNHEPITLSEEALAESKALVVEFQNCPNKKKQFWKRIQTFYNKPGIFKTKDLQLYVRRDIVEKFPELKDNEYNEMLTKILGKGFYTDQREMDKFLSDRH